MILLYNKLSIILLQDLVLINTGNLRFTNRLLSIRELNLSVGFIAVLLNHCHCVVSVIVLIACL